MVFSPKLPHHSGKATSSRSHALPSSSSRRRLPQKSTYLIASLVLIIFFWRIHSNAARPPSPVPYKDGSTRPSPVENADLSKLPELPCYSLPGAEDVLVVMRTGSTEFEDKLPVHLTTTLRCYPNYMIFSDYEEDYHGEHIFDALEFVDPQIQSTHPDFEIWRRLRSEGGRTALKPSERSGPISRPQGATGKPSNPGWKLDKWKFLPMMNRTLTEYPDMKWYLFVETDTHIMWQTLLNYLQALDWRKPIYMGGQIWIGDIVFAHGGTGFVVSNPALKLVVQHFVDHQKHWEDFTNWHWAGDCVLGKAFRDSGTELTPAWPIFQADDIGDMNYARNENGMRLWCMPTVSYHHLSPSVVEDMWNWEQEWIKATKDPTAILHHRDVYGHYVLPRVTQERRNWDNHASDDQGPVYSLDDCRTICMGNDTCLQYAISTDLRCLTSSRPNLGELSRGVDSGWVYERMKRFRDVASWCVLGNSWIMP